MPSLFRAFWKSQDAGVSVDWVVLTGSLIAMAAIMLSSVQSETAGLAADVGTVLSDVEVTTIGVMGFPGQ